MAALTLPEVKNYLRVDYNEDDTLISSLMAAADEYMKASVGESYDIISERAKALSLIIISDLYDNRGLNNRVSGNVRKLVEDMALQLRLELRL